MRTQLSDAQLSAMQFQERILSALQDGILGLGRDGVVRYCNAAALELLGLPPESEIVGRSIHEILSPPGDSTIHSTKCPSAEQIAAAIDQGKRLGPTNLEYRRSDGNKDSTTYLLIPIDAEYAALVLLDAKCPTRARSPLYLAHFDALTGLLNRSSLQQVIDGLHQDHCTRRMPYSLVLVDMDRFKLVNDAYGHDVGDEVLRCATARMQEAIRTSDSIGRWGGEEFLLVLPGTPIEHAKEVASRIRRAVAGSPYVTDGGAEIPLTVSIGVASFPRDGESIDRLLSTADSALSEAKRGGRDRVCLHNPDRHSGTSIAIQLERAIAEHRIVAAFQPIVDVHTGAVVADETLARMLEPGQPPLPAGLFIDTARQLMLSHRIDFDLAVETIALCRDRVLSGASPRLHFVNVSADLLRHPELVEELLDASKVACQTCFQTTQVEKPLVIELTERSILDDISQANRLLKPFVDFGIRLAIDNFGGGFSSLLYLAELPIRFLKLDGRLIERAPSDKKARAILRGVQRIADDLDIVTVAEKVESEAMLSCARDLGIAWAQGYHIGRPEIALPRQRPLESDSGRPMTPIEVG